MINNARALKNNVISLNNWKYFCLNIIRNVIIFLGIYGSFYYILKIKILFIV